MNDSELISKIKELLNEDKKSGIEVPPFIPFEEQNNDVWIMGLLILMLMSKDYEYKETPTINIYFGVDE